MSITRAQHRHTGLLTSKALSHLSAFRREVERAMPGEIARVALFGSRARGDARSDSDYDVAVFVRNLKEGRPVDHLLTDTAYPHVLAGVHIRPVAVPADYLESHHAEALAMSIAREAIDLP